MKLNLTQYAFTTGKAGRELFSRKDVDSIASSVQELINGTPLEQGPIQKRTGSEFICATKYSDKKVRLLEFEFSVSDSLVLEMGDYYVRFFVNRAIVLDAAEEIYEVVTPYSEDILDELSVTTAGDVIYFSHSSRPPITLTRYGNSNWVVADAIFDYGPYQEQNTDRSAKLRIVSGTLTEGTSVTVGRPVDSTDTPFADMPLEELQGRLLMIAIPATNLADGGIAKMRVTQAYNNYTLTCKLLNTVEDEDVQTKLMADEGVYTWRWGAFGPQEVTTAFAFSSVKPGSPSADQIYNLHEVAAGFGDGAFTYWNDKKLIWLGENSTMNEANTEVESGYWIGKYTAGEGSGWIKNWRLNISMYGGTTHQSQYGFTGSMIPPAGEWEGVDNLPDGFVGTYYDSRLPTYPSTVDDLWPHVVGLHQERLIFGATPRQLQTLFFSVVGDYTDFCPVNDQNEVVADQGLTVTLSGPAVNDIAWLISSTSLLVGTGGAEYAVIADSAYAPITSTDMAMTLQSARGSVIGQRPRLVNKSTVFIQRLGAVLRSLEYDAIYNTYSSKDLTRLCPSILSDDGGGVKLVTASEPANIIYCRTANGKIKSFTYEADDKVEAWSEFEFGGDSPVVISMAVIPNDEDNYYDKYFAVQREIDGSTVTYIEVIGGPVSDRNYWNYLDCSLSYHDEVTAISTASGLDHLEGETVTIFADGEYRGTAVVDAGSVALGDDYNHVIIGLPYNTVIQLNSIESANDQGTSFGKQKRTLKLSAQFDETVAPLIGLDLAAILASTDNEYTPRDEEGAIISIVEPQTGTFSIEPEEDFSDIAGEIYIVQKAPGPFTLLSVTREVEFRD